MNSNPSSNRNRKRLKIVVRAFLSMTIAGVILGLLHFRTDDYTEYFSIIKTKLQLVETFYPKSFKSIKTAKGELIERLCNCNWYDIVEIYNTKDPKYIEVHLVSGKIKTIPKQEIRKLLGLKKRHTVLDIASLFGDYYNCCVQEFQLKEDGTRFINLAYVHSISKKKRNSLKRDNYYRHIKVLNTTTEGKIRFKTFELNVVNPTTKRLVSKFVENHEAALFSSLKAFFRERPLELPPG